MILLNISKRVEAQFLEKSYLVKIFQWLFALTVGFRDGNLVKLNVGQKDSVKKDLGLKIERH